MENFVRRQNIEHFRRLLQTVTDESERQRILALLKDEEQKQKEVDGLHRSTGPG